MPFSICFFPVPCRDAGPTNKKVNRKDPKTGKNWVPKKHSRICSKHFPDGKPTKINPYPILELGYRACYQTLKQGRREIMHSPLPSTCNWKTHEPSSVDQNHEYQLTVLQFLIHLIPTWTLLILTPKKMIMLAFIHVLAVKTVIVVVVFRSNRRLCS